jgi:glutathione S-transferase
MALPAHQFEHAAPAHQGRIQRFALDQLDAQLALEDVWGNDDILKSNPLGKVPCLVLDGGEAVFDSRVIVEYLDTLSPVGKLIPPSGRERIEVKTWEALADGLPADTALSQARKAVAAQGNRQEWATPVLFSRSDDNRLIELPQGDRRAEVGAKPFEPETVFIPGGPFPMGTDDPAAPAWEQPQHPVDLPDFRIGRYPVTVRQYASFVKDQKDQPAPPGWLYVAVRLPVELGTSYLTGVWYVMPEDTCVST